MHQMISLLPFLTYHPLPHLLKILASDTPLLSTETQHSHDNPSEPLASQFLTSLLPPQPPTAHRHALHLVTTSNNTNFKIVIPKSLEARRSRNRESRPSIVFSHLEQRSSPESGTYLLLNFIAQQSTQPPGLWFVLPTSWASVHLRGLFHLWILYPLIVSLGLFPHFIWVALFKCHLGKPFLTV